MRWRATGPWSAGRPTSSRPTRCRSSPSTTPAAPASRSSTSRWCRGEVRSTRFRRGGPSARPAGRRPAVAQPARPAGYARAGRPRAGPYKCGDAPTKRAFAMTRVLIHVQHLLGTGHLRRAAAIAAALAQRGAVVTLLSGGPPVANLAVGGARLVQLHPVRAADATFRTLLDADGRAVDDA